MGGSEPCAKRMTASSCGFAAAEGGDAAEDEEDEEEEAEEGSAAGDAEDAEDAEEAIWRGRTRVCARRKRWCKIGPGGDR